MLYIKPNVPISLLSIGETSFTGRAKYLTEYSNLLPIQPEENESTKCISKHDKRREDAHKNMLRKGMVKGL